MTDATLPSSESFFPINQHTWLKQILAVDTNTTVKITKIQSNHPGARFDLSTVEKIGWKLGLKVAGNDPVSSWQWRVG